MRTAGAKNIVSLETRTTIDTSNSADIGHFANFGETPLKEFCDLLKHQDNFLSWVEGRHDSIVKLKTEINTLKGKAPGKGPTGAKNGTTRKYLWFSEQLVLLDAINAFETFYKKTFVMLGAILNRYVQPDPARTVTINALQLWNAAGQPVYPSLVPELAFEHQLFHDLDAVDKASDLLIGARRYLKKSQNNPRASLVKALSGIFQIRHTLSHNHGFVTEGDSAKFSELQFTITQGEIIDPVKSQLGIAISRALKAEAEDFTEWLTNGTSTFLTRCVNMQAIPVPAHKRQELESLLGTHPSFSTVPWS